MAVPSSGQLRLRADIALEVVGNSTGSDISLRAMADASSMSSPDAMSEFYSYSNASPPSVNTNGGSSITDTRIVANGNVSSDGGGVITERGFYFGTSTNRASNPKYIVGGTTGGFSLNRNPLSASSTYYWWAYATNVAGTTYGAMQQATTGAAVSYSTTNPGGFSHYPSEPEMYVQEAAGRNEFNLTWQYHHVYNGWTNTNSFNKVVTNDAYPSISRFDYSNNFLWGRTGVLTSNRCIFRYRLGAPFWSPQPVVTMDMRVGDGSSTWVGWEYYSGAVAQDNPNRSYSSSGTNSTGVSVGYEYNNNEGYYSGRSYYSVSGLSQTIDITRIMNQTHYG